MRSLGTRLFVRRRLRQPAAVGAAGAHKVAHHHVVQQDVVQSAGREVRRIQVRVHVQHRPGFQCVLDVPAEGSRLHGGIVQANVQQVKETSAFREGPVAKAFSPVMVMLSIR